MKITRRQIRKLIKEAGEANISHFTNFEKDTGAFKQYAEDMLDTIADHYKDDKDNPTRIPQMSDKWRGMVTDKIAQGIVSAFAKGIGYNQGTGGSKAPEWHRKPIDNVVQFPGGKGGPERLAAGKIMKITKKQLRRIIKENLSRSINEYGPNRNALPPRDSSWYDLAKALDIGELDLDDIAYDLGFTDFRDMDISISPKALAERDPDSFVVAVQDSSMKGSDMGPNEILELVGAQARVRF